MFDVLAPKDLKRTGRQYIKHVGLVLDQDFSFKCWEGAHMFYATIALIAVFVYLIGVPLFTFVVLYCNRHRLHTAAIEQRFGDLVREGEGEGEERRKRCFVL